MKGLFTRERINSLRPEIKEESCLECGLQNKCKSPKMTVGGSGTAKAMFLAEAPGKSEDEQGDQLVGKSGTYLNLKLVKQRYNLNRDFYKLNAVNCRTSDEEGNNRTPTIKEVSYCRPYVMKQIAEIDPILVIGLGEVAVLSLLEDDFKMTSIRRFRGFFVPDQTLKRWLTFTYHPAYMTRLSKDANAQAFYDHEIERIVKFIAKQPEFPVYSDQIQNVKMLMYPPDVLDVIQKAQSAERVYIDLETNRLKPYVHGSKLATIALSFDDKAYAFPYQYRNLFSQSDQDLIKISMIKLLSNTQIKFVAHNAKFEHIWLKVFFDVDVHWHWCTLQAAHIQDNRQRWTGLKFQTWVNFGHRPYDKHIGQYLTSSGSHGFNRIEEAPERELLLYNGLDTRWGDKLYLKQRKWFEDNPNRKQAFDLFHQGSIVLASLQHNGIHVNTDYCVEQSNSLREKIEVVEKVLENSEEAALFQQHTGRKLLIRTKDYSDHDLRILFYDVLNFSTDKKTASSKVNSVDESTLSTFQNKFADLVLKRRKLRKMEGYLNQYLRETYDGVMHPFFDLIVPVTYRGSSNDPNFQNIPKRDALAKKIVRRAIIPSPGNKILESDFSGIEVAINACYNKDPNLVRYVCDSRRDMHRDTAGDLWLLPQSEITKDIRFYAKNMWVFAEFYGSWYAECSKNLWNTCLDLKAKSNFTLRDHLASKGITTLEQFEKHCKKVEDSFWKKRFKVYQQWKDDVQLLYQDQGFLETYLGFVFSGLMTYNEATNYFAQGTAFHILLWTLINTHKTFIEEGLRSKLSGQIHDSIFTDLYPSEEKRVIEIISYWGEQKTKEAFDWIVVPLRIEHEITEIDGSWYTKREI